MDAGDAARAAMAQREDVQPEWVITTFGTLVDGLKAATTSPDTSPIPPRRLQRVMVLADGFAWSGRTFDSLSKVAFAITGTKWNGPRFFGIRDKEDAFHVTAVAHIGRRAMVIYRLLKNTPLAETGHLIAA